MYESRICGAVDLGGASLAGWDGGYELFECFASVYYKRDQLSDGSRAGQWDLPVSVHSVDIVKLQDDDMCDFVVSVCNVCQTCQRSPFLVLNFVDSLC